MPLDKEMKEQIEELRQPYPKREKQAMAVPAVQRRGSADPYAPILEGGGDTISPLIANAS